MSVVLEVRGLGVRFGGIRAVDGVSFDAESNAITTIIGPNGAGKSTLFNLISGMIRPSSGKVMLRGVDLTGRPPYLMQRAGMGRSFQITNLFFELTVFENLRLAAQRLETTGRFLLPVRRSERALARVHELVERFALAPKAGELAGALSHGEQRRLEIAVALATEPSILLLDEPTQGMSHSDTADTAALIRDLARDVTILLIEHDIGVVMDISNHIVVMHQGRKLAEGAPAVVRADPAVKSAYFGHA
ncbi:branched-chain amino acid transport system ATP-binding protein [Rhodopseudomonas rhenobacensis]|uniref:Branched-chain amino acid transport system ATP-binding protein n=1 Tax=Rhodopseudomonas rhenobacensis TaxID=87461 RepID=A0A7W7Z508_9BRAD|nr:ABC transporter ATP-binding protein [Rhodopseudomonas rhenobacensis]MBB5047968.1 branched-chain amino acid transport system ATP-binding protein [Rhodopseudomonas rhenobacensis]